MDTKRIVVNYWLLKTLSELGALSQTDKNMIYKTVDGNDPKTLKWYVKQFLLPWLSSDTESAKAWRPGIYHNLRYFLAKGDIPAEHIFDQCDEHFGDPDDPMIFYRCAWEVLFPDEDYRATDLNDYVEDNDIEVLSRSRPPIEYR